MNDLTVGSVEAPKDIGTSPRDIVRRWLLEIKIASKTERKWRETGQKVYDRYRGNDAKKSSFNILWSNTELLRPAIYNSTPKPEARRRFKDADPVGKVVSDVLQRSLEFSVDNYNFDDQIKLDVLDMLIPGRGLSRVRYIPKLVPQINDDADAGSDAESMEGDAEELAWEQVTIEHINWRDFRHGPGKTWGEVTWVAFRHDFTRDQMVEHFGEEIGSAIELSDPAEDEVKNLRDDPMSELFKTGEVWEVWDKDDKQVLFCTEGYPTPCKTLDDPLDLEQFFPIPCPLRAIEDSDSLTPIPLYEQYKEQADELDTISTRINKIVSALKVRGVYDATMTELSSLMTAGDNDLIAVQAGAAMYERGGLEKGIWWMPIEQLAMVLKELYEQRDQAKQIIYEITGIADIMRGASDPDETKGAQVLKHQWGTVRLQKMQREVQRYVRDIICLMAEIIGEKFQPETLLAMTGLKIPTQAQVQAQMMAQMQQASQQPGQPPQPSPAPQQPPVTLEQVLAVIRNDASRSYRIDVQTDSTIAATQQEDMQGLQQVLTGVIQFAEGVSPLVQAGFFPVEAAKEIILSICRRAEMGGAVEDALDKISQPAPQTDPHQTEVMKAQAAAQAQQQKAQSDAQLEQVKQQYQAQSKQAESAAKAQADQMAEAARAHADQAIQEVRVQAETRIEQMKAEMEMQKHALETHFNNQQSMQDNMFEKWKAELESNTRIIVAEIAAKVQLDAQAKQAEQLAQPGD